MLTRRRGAASGTAALVLTAALFIGCSQGDVRGAVVDAVTVEALSAFEYVESEDFIEPETPEGAGHTLDVRVFVESMMPFVVYREFGTGFESPDDQGIAFEEWLQEHVVVVGDYPSGYLVSLMWVLLAPPVEFQRVVLEHELIDNGLTEWQPDQFRERYPEYLYELARIWLDHNDEHRPDWLRVE